MRIIFRYLRPYRGRMARGLAIKAGGTLIELALPYILSLIINRVVGRGAAGPILFWGGMMTLCALLALLGNVTANRMAGAVARDGARAMRHDLFVATMALDSTTTDRFTVPSLESRLTSDTYHVHHFMGMIQRLGVRAPLLLIGGLAVTLIQDPVLTLPLLAVLPLIGVSVAIVGKKGVPMYTDVQKAVDGMVRVVREDAQGIRVIKALSRTDYEKKRYEKVNRSLVFVDTKVNLIMALSNPLIGLFLNLGLVAVIVLGAYRVSAGRCESGTILAFIQYFTLISNAMISITRVFVMYTKGAASAARIGEVIDAAPDILAHTQQECPPIPTDDAIVFSHVCFSYRKMRDDLHDISFSLRRGGTLGIIGATGSGKTTILALLQRFYDADSGAIYLSGRDIRTMNAEELHTRFGIVAQNDFLYADTVAENINFGRGLTDEQIQRAAADAQAGGFISNLEGGYQHRLTPKGNNLSGGQRQRLLMARALAGDPEILLLDDATSALDYRTDANLRHAIAARSEKNKTTSVIVAQRVCSVMHADRILVLEEGIIIGDGTHETLMETCPVYREIAMSQLEGGMVDG